MGGNSAPYPPADCALLPLLATPTANPYPNPEPLQMEASMFFSQDQYNNTNNQTHVLIISKEVTDR